MCVATIFENVSGNNAPHSSGGLPKGCESAHVRSRCTPFTLTGLASSSPPQHRCVHLNGSGLSSTDQSLPTTIIEQLGLLPHFFFCSPIRHVLSETTACGATARTASNLVRDEHGRQQFSMPPCKAPRKQNGMDFISAPLFLECIPDHYRSVPQVGNSGSTVCEGSWLAWVLHLHFR